MQLEPAELCTALAAALLLPLRGITVAERKAREPAPAWLVRDGIKWNNRDAEGVAALHACAPQLAQVHQQLQVLPSQAPWPQGLRCKGRAGQVCSMDECQLLEPANRKATSGLVRLMGVAWLLCLLLLIGYMQSLSSCRSGTCHFQESGKGVAPCQVQAQARLGGVVRIVLAGHGRRARLAHQCLLRVEPIRSRGLWWSGSVRQILAGTRAEAAQSGCMADQEVAGAGCSHRLLHQHAVQASKPLIAVSMLRRKGPDRLPGSCFVSLFSWVRCMLPRTSSAHTKP